MGIIYDESKKVFLINTVNTSYAIGITALGYLKHLHWGGLIDSSTDFFLHPKSNNEKIIAGLDSAAEPEQQVKRVEKENFHQRLDEEYSGWGGYFYGDPGLKVTFADGVRDLLLKYHSHNINEDAGGCELQVRMKDNVYDFYVDLYYRVYTGLDVIDRWVRVVNETNQTATIESIMSAMWHFPRGDQYRLTHMYGKWSGEFRLAEVMLTQSNLTLETKTGISAHHSCPWFAADWQAAATEEDGELYAGTLHWSGNWRITAQRDNLERVRVTGGIHDFDFEWPLAPGEEFTAPIFSGVYTTQGFGGASRQFHGYMRNQISPQLGLEKPQPIMYSTWGSLYTFESDIDKELEIVPHAAAMGMELYHVDDVWFSTRDNDYQGLGDWWVSKKKFPDGLKPLIDSAKAHGMEFGIWVEPEMVSPDTELFRDHPEWVIKFPGKQMSTGRNQYVLNFGMKEVQDWAIDWITDLLGNNDIDFFKWDMNRYISEPGWEQMPIEQQKTIWVRYVQGLYRVFAAVKERFPKVYVQNCASGGGRVDMGLMRYCDDVTMTDCGNPWDRVKIVWGYSQLFAPSSNAASWKSRMWGEPALPSELRGWVVDPRKYSDEDKAKVRKVNEDYYKLRHIIHKGDMYRLASPYKDEYVAYEFVLPDKSEALVHVTCLKPTYERFLPMLRLRGLDPDAIYEMNGHPEMTGKGLMSLGLDVTFDGELDSYMIHLRKK